MANPVGVPINGISKIHSLQLRGDEVVAREFPCFTCTMGTICEECMGAEGVKGDFHSEEAESDVGLPPRFEEEEGVNTDDDGSDDDSDGADEEGEDEEELEGVATGGIFWAPFR